MFCCEHGTEYPDMAHVILEFGELKPCSGRFSKLERRIRLVASEARKLHVWHFSVLHLPQCDGRLKRQRCRQAEEAVSAS